jgi:hypothetical protein
VKKKKTAIVQWRIPTIPNRGALTKQTSPLVERANTFEIKSEDHFIASWPLVQLLDEAIKTVESAMDPFVKGLHYLHKMACQMRDGFLEPLQDAKDGLLERRMDYRQEQEEIKQKADAAAAKAMQKAQQKELELQARAADRAGEKQVAQVLREQKATMPLPFMNTAPAVPKQEGSVIKKRWKPVIDDPALVPREWCAPDMSLIRPEIERLGDKANIPGVHAELEEKEHSRGVA